MKKTGWSWGCGREETKAHDKCLADQFQFPRKKLIASY